MLTPFKPTPYYTKFQFVHTPHDFPKECCIRCSEEFEGVPAPCFRKIFSVKKGLQKAALLVCGQGFYEARCNGGNITKGPLAPYRSNPNHIVYMDEYDITDRLAEGKNALGFLLGSGILCTDFARARYSKAPWRRAPFLAFRLTLTYGDGEEIILSDESVKTALSPLLEHDLFLGEAYDARLEQPGWDTADFDDSLWKNAERAPNPIGEERICEADPIGYFEELEPVSIVPYEDGYVYDFGVNYAGVCRLRILGEAGQTVTMAHFEAMWQGRPLWKTICKEDAPFQVDRYTCRGGGEETWLPRFTYHGFRYVLVTGITEEQAAKSLLTYVVMHSDMPQLGSFTCDNEMVNALQEATMRANYSNFFHFPTDCPHREKMGWTGDAALSCEQMMMNFDPSRSYTEWLRSIHKAMTDRGSLPGIVPSAGTTYVWGNGPAWDRAMVELPWQMLRLRGETQAAGEAVIPLMRYLTFLTTKRDERGLICFGLGDWCDVTQKELYCTTPLALTDSIIAVDIAKKAADIFAFAGRPTFKTFADDFAASLTADIREHLIDHDRLLAYGETQAAQALALYHGMFTEEEFDGAFQNLLTLIHGADDHFACGILGARVLFRLLAEHGEAELALKLIVREDGPSYGAGIVFGSTCLWEEYANVTPPRGDENHHMWGDISAWFYRYLAGIRLRSATEVDIAPCFVASVNEVTASHRMPVGEVKVQLQKRGGAAALILEVPDAAKGRILLPKGWQFADGAGEKVLQSGVYAVNLSS